MAFTTNLTLNGRTYPVAYIKATLVRCDTQSTVLKLQAWETQALREEGVPSLPWDSDLYSLTTDMDLQAVNPIDYSYQLLQASDKFPDATWNV